jgi:NADPH:quinone reductase-like Zn-dependent oxidoreductase
MKAIVQDRYGSADVLKLEEIEKPAVGKGQVILRVGAAAAWLAESAGVALHSRKPRETESRGPSRFGRKRSMGPRHLLSIW